MLSRANNGQWNGGRVPYGYKYDKSTKTILVDEEEGEVVKKIYSLYQTKQSLLYIARYLTDSGVKPKSTSSGWSATTVQKILRNPFYTGAYQYNVHRGGRGIDKKDSSEWIVVPDHHEALVDQETFDRIDFILRRNRRSNIDDNKAYVCTNDHIFAGMVICGSCGANMSASADKIRADGWRPSMYGCATRRKSKDKCRNKYTSDPLLVPFVFNYLGNILRAKQDITKRTSLETLQSKLLRGPAFESVVSIDEDGLSQLRDLLLSGKTGVEYKPAIVFDKTDSGDGGERARLEAKRRKAEIALNRLKSLYLYGDEQIPEKDFIIERKRITDELEETEAKLKKLSPKSAKRLEDDEGFLDKASYLIMVDKLLDSRVSDCTDYIRSLDRSIPRDFVRNAVEKITVLDGRVVAIQFKNGITHKFQYE